MTFPANYNLTGAKKENVRCSQVIDSLYEVGLTETETPAHNIVRVYNRERTLCDILKKSKQTDIQLITQAFKEYAKLPDKNIVLLSEYSKLFRVSKKVRSYLEVLLCEVATRQEWRLRECRTANSRRDKAAPHDAEG